MNDSVRIHSALQSVLRDADRVELQTDGMTMACVSLILRWHPSTSETKMELGFIRRSLRAGDPWGGQLAFPGGKVENSDPSDLVTATREVFEEIGIPLSAKELLGRLSDQQARNSLRIVPLFLRPFVFFLEENHTPILQPDEVQDFFWVRLETLFDPKLQVDHKIQVGHQTIWLPGIDLGYPMPLWGLTYKIVTEFAARLMRLENAAPAVWAQLGLQSDQLRKWRPAP